MATKPKKTDKLDQISFIDEFDWKLGHGGKRNGSGRPKGSIETKVMRVPVELASHVKRLIDDYKEEVQ